MTARRRYGAGSVYTRPGGSSLEIQYYVDGRRVRENTNLPPSKWAEAEKLLRQRQAAADAGQVVATQRAVRWEDLGALLVADYQANAHRSLDRTKRSLKHLAKTFGGARAKAVTADRLARYVSARLDEGAAAATVNRELAALRRAFRLGVQRGLVGHVPVIKNLVEASPRAGFFERAQLDAVIAHLPTDIAAPIRAAYITGWRIRSELLTRQWQHVDLAAGWLRLDPGETKNRQGRMFPITDELRDVLLEQKRRTDALTAELGAIIPWVFHREGRRILDFYGAWRKACRDAGVPGKIPHDFRRTAVRNLERAGVPRSAAMAMVGHKTEAIYRRYSIVEETMLKEAAAKLDVAKL